MTSSSDTELGVLMRRVSVHGLPTNCQSSELRSLFSTFGGITAVHVTRHGLGFVTFDEEESANASLSISGATFRDHMLTVKLSQWHDNPSLPVIGAKREIYFPRPFGGRGGQASGTGSSYRSANGSSSGQSSRPRNSGTSGPSASSSRSVRSLGPTHRPSLLSLVKVVEVESHSSKNQIVPLSDEESQLFLSLLSFKRFPEISENIFSMLDIISLYRCRLVCRSWAENLKNFVLQSPSATRRRREAWSSSDCSIFPLTTSPNDCRQMEENPESRYRNVLSVKADEKDILLALDNGSVEVYDRLTRNLSYILAGQYSISPVGLDINSSFILVNYTCAFVNRFRMPMPSSWWSIFCRKSRKLVRVIERETARSYEDVRLGSDHFLHLVTKNSIYFIDFSAVELLTGGNEDLSTARRSSRILCPNLVTQQVVSIHVGNENPDMDTLEAVDIDTQRIVGVVKRASFNQILLCSWRKPSEDELLVNSRSRTHPKVDFMTRLDSAFPILEESKITDFDIAKCSCLSMQLRYPLCLVLLSNNRGLFEVLNSCRPYVLFAIADLQNEVTLRVLTLDCAWMLKMSDMLVPYDCDTCVLTAKFNTDFLVAGFGSSSDIKDGGIAVWSLSELLSEDNDKCEPKVFTLPSPVYHWAGWDGHTGGVTDIHLDSWGMVAINACKHQVTTRCIERYDETKKDNVLVYDFWRPGKDERREQR